MGFRAWGLVCKAGFLVFLSGIRGVDVGLGFRILSIYIK